VTEGSPPSFDQSFRRQLEVLLQWRRDVRRFRSDPIDEETLRQLIAIIGTAPSVGFSQPTRLVIVRNVERRAAVLANFIEVRARAQTSYEGERAARYASLKLEGLREAPVHLAVFCDEDTETGAKLGARTMPETHAYSTVLAIGTLWLAARARGIGVGWVSILDPDKITEILAVPPAWRFIAYLCVGYPQEEHVDRELERAGWEKRDPRSVFISER
jgi:5,6-dimethylbenzimidazole synthase